MPYKVKLESFEGPLDLLLFLIKKNELDIYDIPISEITRQYLDYIEIIKLLDIEAAGDFILMAATLMRIKAQTLLPKPEMDEMDEIEDPRQELVYRLLEYKRFKDVASDLAEKEKRPANFFRAAVSSLIAMAIIKISCNPLMSPCLISLRHLKRSLKHEPKSQFIGFKKSM